MGTIEFTDINSEDFLNELYRVSGIKTGTLNKLFRQRGFEVVSKYKDEDIHLPQRATQQAAGYDFECAERTEIPSYREAYGKPTLVATGIKAYMQGGEQLVLANRSGNPLKKGLLLANGVGIIDADYYDNPGNEGHIMFQFWNMTDDSIVIEKGERLGQGIFMPYLLTDNDSLDRGNIRQGGFGSTGEA